MLYNFLRAISYNIFNIFLYKIILQLHQIALFGVISNELFGLAGTLFSSIYFLISITNIGFDYFIITYHHAYTASRENFKKLIPLFIARLCCIVIALLLLWYINHYILLSPVTTIVTHTTPLLLAIIIGIFISESIKKSLDVLAQMSFLQKSISIFDITTLIMYVCFVWGYYFIYHQITLYIIFGPMLCISLIECYWLAKVINDFYYNLPDEAYDKTITTPLPRTIISNQIINYINQISKALFSPNFFIIILACYLGLSKVGHIKLFTDIIVLLYMLLNRSFGLPAAALFSSVAKQSNISLYKANVSFSQKTLMEMISWPMNMIIIFLFIYRYDIVFFAYIDAYFIKHFNLSIYKTYHKGASILGLMLIVLYVLLYLVSLFITNSIVRLYLFLNLSSSQETKLKQTNIEKKYKKLSLPQQAFMKVINWYIQFLYALGIIISFIISTCYISTVCVSSVIFFNSMLFIFAGFVEYLVIAYEKWYLTQDKAWILGIANGINLVMYAFLFLSIHFLIDFPSEFILVPIILFRLCCIIAIMYIAYRVWGITLSWRIRTLTIVVSALISLIIYLVNHYILITL